MSTSNTLAELLKPREAAAVLRVSIGHLANERSQGLGPKFVKFNGRVLYAKESLAEYIAAHVVTPTRRRTK